MTNNNKQNTETQIKLNYYDIFIQEKIDKLNFYQENLETKQYEAKEFLEQSLRHLQKLYQIQPVTQEDINTIGNVVVDYINYYEKKLKTYRPVMNLFYENSNKNYSPKFYKQTKEFESIIEKINELISKLTVKYIKYFIKEETIIDKKI